MIGVTRTVRQLVGEGAIERPMDGNHGELHPKTSHFVPSGIPFIMASDLKDGVLDLENCAFITPELAKTLRKGFAKTGDVLLSHKATMGRTAIVGVLATPHVVLTPQVTYYRVLDERKLNRIFLKYYFDSPAFQSLFASWGDAGSTRSYLGISAQLDLPIVVPPIERQGAIAEVLGALDDKIRLNRKLNRSMEALASSSFRSWFVDFNPVVAKRDGKAPVGVPAEAIDLFPGHFEESALGPIPQGWRLSTIGAEVTVVGGSTPSTNEPRFWNGDVCFVTPRDLSRLDDPIILDTERHITQEGLGQISSGLLPVGTVLLSSRAPIGYIAVAEVPVAINQGFIAMKCDKELSANFAVDWVRENLDEVLSRAGGTTFAEISKGAFRPIPAVVPRPEVLEVFDAIVAPLHAMRVANVRESCTLAELRDTLLGPLLSGELTIKSAEKAVGAAL